MAPRELLRGLRRRLDPARRRDDIARNLSRFAAYSRPAVAAAGKRPADFEKHMEVIIPCYNHAAYLADAYHSLGAQSWSGPLTITFIDDHSSDGTAAEIRRLVAEPLRPNWQFKTIFNTSNLRQWRSLNKAVEASENALLVILNDDDLLVPNCLELIVETYRQHPEIWMLGGSSLWFDSDSDRPAWRPAEGRPVLTIHSPSDVTGYHQLNDLNMTHSSSSFFRKAWEVVGGYRPVDQRIHSQANEDRDFQMRLNALFEVGVYSDYPMAWWRTDSTHGKSF